MEKRIISIFSVCLLIMLVICTSFAKENHLRSLPSVTTATFDKPMDGSVVFPSEAIFRASNGMQCVYQLVIEDGAFGSKRYYTKEVLVSAESRLDGQQTVRGLYYFDDPYVMTTSANLSDGDEVQLTLNAK